ncbi:MULTISPECIES: autotransporter outer membrane beta-barrel domain-containing protein [Pseudomonas]|uniref:Autotransporter outer membrane beta-barrel domain-containing protein n=1 Tax=Pseudomonas cedrina TaxID=651740 RepID=A0A2S9DQF6_PSECE|nr:MULTISPECIES: autotransporter outer membrane beta-barrel domain-containing protein [Pseudomonas]AVJ22581.1 autotransporter outer membrane beta-barrel domain-containing protein [Pseudomonas sp. MYb193]PRC04814.1 autotransporter outer membrane beta-barrel domain-containing protein [Pseudomonas cedrina]
MPKTTGLSTRAVLAVGFLSLQYMTPQSAHAACVLSPGTGNDTYTCDSGSSPGLTDLSGDNSLTLSTGGTINGNVTFGPGVDRVEIRDGLITGVVQQGAGIDDFLMTGGQIQALFQGDGLDTFRMENGRIVGAFEDGDVAYQSGGAIGRVNMKLDKNFYEMTGGTIEGNLVTGFDVDTIRILNGFIGGNISTSGGDDSITVSGGVINGEIRASVGNDTFNWLGGGQINSSVLMGDGDDTALLRGLSESLLANTPSVDGGLGNDQLTFDNTTASTPARYVGWETVNLNNASRFDLAGDFFLGDSASNTGTFNIDGSSTLAVTQGGIRPYTAGQLATFNNAGTVDMTTDNSATSVLTVHGNYVGNNGQLHLQTVLGDDNSATDKLVVSDGSISGHTQLGVSNLGGVGGLTQNNGIEVVQALNGAVSSTDAFALNGQVSAGAYQYMLFKGGVTAGTENNWYLRSSVVAVQPPAVPSPPPPVVPPVVAPPPIPVTPPQVDPDEPPTEPPTAQPVAPIEPPAPPPSQVAAVTSPQSAASNPVLPSAVAGAAPIALYRLEVPVYSVDIPAAQVMTLQALGTFHQRQGEQSLLTETGAVPAGWGRAYGSDFNKSWSGTVTPSFDGTSKGYQVGHDLYASETSGGQTQRFGLFIGQSRLRGDVQGFALGWQNHRSGRVKLDGDNFGAYWTLTDPTGWYVDLVAMGTRLDGDNKSDRGVKMDIEGHAVTLSAEAGYPLTLSEHWVVEPQAQVIGQKIDLDSQHDGISKVSFDSQEYWTGRLGARLKGRYLVSNMPVEPYLRANVWHTFGGSDTVTFDDVDRIKSDHKSSTADVGVGVVAQLSSAFSVYMEGSYGTQLDDNNFEGGSGTVGMRVKW